MMLKECRDWLSALQDCYARGRLGRLEEAVARVGERHPGGRWQGSVESKPGLETLRLRFLGDADFAVFKKTAAGVFGLPSDGRSVPPASFPWVSFDWRVASDRLAGASVYGRPPGMRLEPGQAVSLPLKGRPVLHNPKPFAKNVARDRALGPVFADFVGLCPVREIVSEWEILESGKLTPREEWSVRLEEPVPWPRFARMNLASPFVAEASQLAYLLLNRRLTEVAFESGSLRAYFRA